VTIPGFEDLMRQAQEFSQRLQQIQEDLSHRTAEGSAGGDMVRATADGRGRILKILIEPTLLQQPDREMIEDLVTAAVNQALSAARQMAQEAMRGLTGGMPIPGLDSLLGG
jgi:nucleoid-associated protein EbfC